MAHLKELQIATAALAFVGLQCSNGPAASPSGTDAGHEGGPSKVHVDGGSPAIDARARDANVTPDSAKAMDAASGPDAELPGWKLTWSDEFEGPDGAAPNPTYWSHDVGGSGWGNDELEYYTDGASNTYQENGNL